MLGPATASRWLQARDLDSVTVPIPIERDEVARLVAVEGAQLVEVLPAVDYDREHITGAVNIPLKQLDERASRELDRSRPVIVYCNDYQ